MATEALAPDALLVQTGLSGAVTAIDDDPDAPDGNWLTTTGQNQTNTCSVSFPTPSGNPTTGAGLQQFRLWLRKSATNAGKTDDTWTVYLYENGSQVGSALASGSALPTSGQLVTADWDAASLSGADGAQVECRVVLTPEGSGSPSSRGCGEVGAIEWMADYSTPSRVVDCETETLSVTANTASVARTRAVNAATEALAVTASAAAIARGRSYDSPTESLVVTPGQAVVGRGRGAVCQTVNVVVTPNQAEIIAGGALDVNCETEFLEVTASAVVERGRQVDAQTYSLAFTVNPGAVETGRGALADTATIVVSPQPAQVERAREVNAQTAGIAVQANPATIQVQRNVNALTAEIVLTARMAQVVRGSQGGPPGPPSWVADLLSNITVPLLRAFGNYKG